MTTTAVTPTNPRKFFDAKLSARKLFEVVLKRPTDSVAIHAFNDHMDLHDFTFEDIGLTVREWLTWVNIVTLAFREKRGP